jgi:uncharacterized protein
MKIRLLSNVIAQIEKRPWYVIIVAIILAIISGGLGSRLELKMNFKDLMPPEHPTVDEYNTIVDNYSAASNIIIGAQGDEEELKAFVNELAPEIKGCSEYVSRVDYKINKDFLENHALMLTKTKDLKNNGDMYVSPELLPLLTAINNGFEKTYINEGEESLSTKEKENQAIASLNGVRNWLETTNRFIRYGDQTDSALVKKGVESFLLGEEYFLSYDKHMILMFVKPTFPVDEMDKSTVLIHKLEDLIEKTKSKYKSIVIAGPAGTMALAVQETDAASEDMTYTSFLSFVLIIALFIISFRMWAAPLLAGVSLIIGILWTSGFAALTVGSLNMMTSMFAVVLIGLGIDFNIHVISAYNENRAAGMDINNAIQQSFKKSGKGIIVGALTTAFAFLTMLIARNAGMKEFAIVAGSGILFSMASALLVLPAMLVVRDRVKAKKAARVESKLEALDDSSHNYRQLHKRLERKAGKLNTTHTINFNIMGQFANAISQKPVIILSAVIAVSILLAFSASEIGFNYNYLSLEPDGLSSIAVQDSMIKYYDATSDMVMVAAPSVERAREITKDSKKLRKTGMVQSISDYIPSDGQYTKRLPYLERFKRTLNAFTYKPSFTNESCSYLIDELYRLEDNLIELGQLAYMGGQNKVDEKVKEIVGDVKLPVDERNSLISEAVGLIQNDTAKAVQNIGYFEREYVPVFKEMSLKMTNTEKITLKNIPEDIYDQFVSADGKNFLVTIYPKEQAWDFSFLSHFSKQMHKIDKRVTGMPLVFYVLINYIGHDGAIAAILTLIIVFSLLLLDFRNLKLALFTMIPLVLGSVWMIGFMEVFGMQLNILNIMAVPLILGVGIDDGVHIIHRYRVEGKHKLSVIFSSTGKAVLITSLSTFLAFGSLGFATAKGLASLGITLSIGIITCYITTIIVLPAIIGLLDKKR